MKWTNREAANSRRWWLAGCLSLVLLAASPAPRAVAQSADCGDTLTLYSPESLTVEFDRQGKPGNRLTWPGLSVEEGSCFRTEIESGPQGRMDPQVFGTYVDFYDRRIAFTATDSGLVGDRTLDQVRLGVSSFPANADVPSFTGVLNLSGRGGLFRGDLGAVSATQSNQGIPVHLPVTDVTAVGAGSASGGTPRLYAAVSGLPIVRSDDGGATWYEPVARLVPAIAIPASHLAVSPNDADLVFLGTSKEGLYRSDDAGVTWAQTALSISSGNEEITVLKYLRVRNASGSMIDRLYLGITGRGFFYSDDDGATWQALSSLVLPAIEQLSTGERRVRCDLIPSTPTQVRVRDVEVSPSDPGRIYVALRDWGVYTTTDHVQWERANRGLVLCAGTSTIPAEDPDFPNGQTATVTQLFVAPMGSVDGDVLYASTVSKGMFLSSDAGQNWNALSQSGFPEVNPGTVATVSALLEDPADPSGVMVATATNGFVAFRTGAWVPWQPAGLTNPKISAAIAMPNSSANDLVIGTSGAGIYEPGVVFDLTRAIAPAPGFEGILTSLGLGLSIDGSSMLAGDRFDIVAQTFQGYAVWRALELDPETQEPEWVMIGLADLTNPEYCSVDPCDAESQSQIPGCFADKRANCFSAQIVNNEVVWSFFDSDVYNGFTYRYAVSTLDYGYVGDVSPLVFDGDFVFSPRSPQESNPQALPFVGARPQNYNLQTFQVNVDAQVDLAGVYAVPNPLRRQGGWDIGTEATVRFVNVTDTSKVQVFTLAGDLVRELENVVTEGVERGNIQWDTRNSEGESVASGVYIYRVTDDAGGEFISRLTIIR